MQDTYINSDKAAFQQKCLQHRLKITPQRESVYEELLRAKDHPSADVLYKRVRKTLPRISFDTVYRTLLSFAKIGVVSLVEGYGETKRFEPNVESHHHFRCMKCHAIIDFENKSFSNLKLPEELQRRFKVMNKRVVLEGICKECSK